MKKIRVLLITVSFIRKNRALIERDKIKMMTGGCFPDGEFYLTPASRNTIAGQALSLRRGIEPGTRRG
jgi:hypothetical protein